MSIHDILTVNNSAPENWQDFTISNLNSGTLNVSGLTTLNNLTITGSSNINPINSVGVNATAVGPWASSQSFNYSFTYIGNPGVTPTLVTLHFSSLAPSTQNNANFIQITPPLPTNLQLINSTNFWIPLVDGGVFALNGGVLSLDGSNIYIYGAGDNLLSGSGSAGWSDFFVSYQV